MVEKRVEVEDLAGEEYLRRFSSPKAGSVFD